MKNPYIGLTLIAFLFCIQSVFSQPICGFDGIHGKAMNTDPSYRTSVLNSEARLQNIILEQQARKAQEPANARTSNTSAVLYTIPVVVHVVHTGGAIGSTYNPTDAKITAAINYLNQVYNGTLTGIEGVGDIQIQFVLAQHDPNCNTTNGIDRLDGSAIPGYLSNGVNANTSSGATELDLKNSSRWDPYSYYNIWVVNKIDGNDGTSGQFIAGFARLAGGSLTYDGTVMLATQMDAGFKTLPHEIGHALALYHPFQGSSDASTCPTNTSCSTQGDFICDTDPISYNQTGGVVNFSCRTGTNPCTGTAYSINTEHNFMNYTNCFTLFTADQKTRMLAAMSLSGRREYAGSWALSGTYPVTYSAPANNCTPVTGPDGLSDNYFGIMNVSISNRQFPSSTAMLDNGYVNWTSSCLNLISLQANGTYTLSTTLLGANYEQINAWIDYNNNGTFESSEKIFEEDNVPPNATYPIKSTSFTIPGSAVQGTVLRMRVMDEAGTTYMGYSIATGCTNPDYGQAEDFAVVISASALPLTMEYFKGAHQGSTNRLFWKTSSEVNTSAFEVERSYNGSDYSHIGTVNAKGTSSGAIYSYDDNSYTGPMAKYRLKQLDLNGDYTYSNIVTIKSATGTDASVNVLNNPFHDQFDLSLTTPVQSKVVINLLDATGKLVYTNTTEVSGNTVLTVSSAAKNLSAGLYIVQVQLNGKLFTKKVIKE